MSGPTTSTPSWDERRARDLQRAGVAVLEGPDGALYRRGQMLVDAGSVGLLHQEARGSTLRSHDERNHRLAVAGVDLQCWLVPEDVALPALHRELVRKRRRPGGAIELNHVLTGEPFYKGGPGGEPRPCPGPALPGAPLLAGGTGPALAVLDTGLPLPRPQHLLASLVADDDTEVDLLNEDGDPWLDTEAGHGTFIGGLVQRTCPGLAVEQRRVLDSYGVGDDLSVCLGLAEASAPVVNLSLGGYTRRDRPPAALAAALSARRHDTVVVAAAGNNGDERWFWPAALPDVVAVAAYDSRAHAPAAFSNRGPWVDVCAPGVDVRSSYVTGRRQVGADVRDFVDGAVWSGTSFAAPLVAAEIARRLVASPGASPRQVADDLLAELPDAGWSGFGRRFDPGVDVTG